MTVSASWSPTLIGTTGIVSPSTRILIPSASPVVSELVAAVDVVSVSVSVDAVEPVPASFRSRVGINAAARVESPSRTSITISSRRAATAERYVPGRPGRAEYAGFVHLRFTTAGESHGPGLVAIVEGLPAGLELDREELDRDMARRQLGHGRGGRMKIESDAIEIRSGVRHGRTLGSPVAVLVANRDYPNWDVRMNPWPVDEEVEESHLPRPGHADLAGLHKYGFSDVRNVLERASARETAARVAAGALAKGFLTALGVSVHSHVIQIASVTAPERHDLMPEDFAGVDDNPVRCLDEDASKEMVFEIDRLRKENESLGGKFEVRAYGLVPGLGSYVGWDRKLDGRLAQAVCSIQSVKGVSLGEAWEVASKPGSEAHDEIFYDDERGWHRQTNH